VAHGRAPLCEYRIVTAVVIEARGLRKDFTVRRKAGWLRRETRVIPAVDGIDLTVRRGETLGYIGPNGAGKSTTLKMFTGVLYPTGGLARVCGHEPVPERLQLARRIGVVFGQRSQLWWDLPLGDSFALLRHIYGVPGGEHAARLAQCRKLLDLDAFLETPVRQLSLGQRMRGELTAALLHGPEVLFLDEPTIGLDVVSKQAVRSFLTSLGQSGDTTLVLTTHDLADIERLCRRLLVIDHGRIVHDGSLEDLHARYGSRRRVVVDLDAPLAAPLAVPGVSVESSEAAGRRVTYALDGGRITAGELLHRLAEVAPIRDITVLEPDIEDVVARLYAHRPPVGRDPAAR
jgi:ABC-2 type transport system ATP-binding protein